MHARGTLREASSVLSIALFALVAQCGGKREDVACAASADRAGERADCAGDGCQEAPAVPVGRRSRGASRQPVRRQPARGGAGLAGMQGQDPPRAAREGTRRAGQLRREAGVLRHPPRWAAAIAAINFGASREKGRVYVKVEYEKFCGLVRKVRAGQELSNWVSFCAFDQVSMPQWFIHVCTSCYLLIVPVHSTF